MTSSQKFVLSFSGGKDGVLALDRALRDGHEAVGLLTTFDGENDCSWFHRIPGPVLRQVGESLGIPLRLVETRGERYAADFERALEDFKRRGAAAVVFGDMDVQEHRAWCGERCANVGMESMFPLWGAKREQCVGEFLDRGYKAVITTVDAARLSDAYLGKTLTHELVSQIAADGVDACGENGEYHTFVYDGPLFRRAIRFASDRPVTTGRHVHLPLIPSAEDAEQIENQWQYCAGNEF